MNEWMNQSIIISSMLFPQYIIMMYNSRFQQSWWFEPSGINSEYGLFGNVWYQYEYCLKLATALTRPFLASSIHSSKQRSFPQWQCSSKDSICFCKPIVVPHQQCMHPHRAWALSLLIATECALGGGQREVERCTRRYRGGTLAQIEMRGFKTSDGLSMFAVALRGFSANVHLNAEEWTIY